MSTLTLNRESTNTTVLIPRVNLLPPEIRDAARFRRLQGIMGGAVIGAVGLVALLTVVAGGQASSAQDALTEAQTSGSTLQTQVNQFAEVPRVFAAVQTAETQLSNAMGEEVRWSFYLNDLSLTIPDRIGLTALSIRQDLGGGGAGAVQSALGKTGIATVTFEGQASTNNDVASFLDALAKQKGYVDPYFSNASKSSSEAATTSNESIVDFAATVTVTDAAKSSRYTPKGS